MDYSVPSSPSFPGMPVPPKLRGWSHLIAAPLVFIASLVLFILSKESFKFAVALYALTAVALFSVSAIYHRVPWSPKKKKIWRRLDHANINLIIAGSYTPFAMTLLAGKDRAVLLWVIWLGAFAGVVIRVFLAFSTALALCWNLLSPWMGSHYLYTTVVPRRWIKDSHTPPLRWFVLFSRGTRLCI